MGCGTQQAATPPLQHVAQVDQNRVVYGGGVNPLPIQTLDLQPTNVVLCQNGEPAQISVRAHSETITDVRVSHRGVVVVPHEPEAGFGAAHVVEVGLAQPQRDGEATQQALRHVRGGGHKGLVSGSETRHVPLTRPQVVPQQGLVSRIHASSVQGVQGLRNPLRGPGWVGPDVVALLLVGLACCCLLLEPRPAPVRPRAPHVQLLLGGQRQAEQGACLMQLGLQQLRGHAMVCHVEEANAVGDLQQVPARLHCGGAVCRATQPRHVDDGDQTIRVYASRVCTSRHHTSMVYASRVCTSRRDQTIRIYVGHVGLTVWQGSIGGTLLHFRGRRHVMLLSSCATGE
mmetsp:Transcript_2092/g.4737  ORF Transcript_2092/g.4737 Transcript_2092/m.4737 type:complete len:343 (-) Transcript_2092:84-1112(-)